ncbi:hypothetical protein [Nocardia vaccinii]|uniref:hypothetical protein n=1 Tax=Nocardia vaccinii TaxID=1822 RepID=UPI000AFADCBD|nr:hypothetical protein [Nocardia vaccinii]
MTEKDEIHSTPTTFVPFWLDAIALTARAATLGYRLVRDNPTPYQWQLLDRTDNTPLYTADTLEDIENWLDT